MTRLSLLAASTIFCALAAPAAMADTKIYPAAGLCIGGSTDARLAVVNLSFTSFINVNCPLGRDRTNAKPTSIEVSLFDNSSLLVGDGDFHCRAVAVSKTGTVQSLGAIVNTSGTSSAGTTLALPVPAANFIDGYYYVNCQVPRRGGGDPASGIGSFKVVEPDPTN
jgi:hypothetical protein